MALAREFDPAFPADPGHQLEDLAVGLAEDAARLSGRLAAPVKTGLRAAMRELTCYYSNLIEGEHTSLLDIERALRKDFADDREQRALQELAFAHVKVQERIDAGDYPRPASSPEFMKWAHHEVFAKQEGLPSWERIGAGEFRTEDVQVGAHVAPAWGDLERQVSRFHQVYGDESLPRAQRVVGIAAAHHRFVWIHPFADGNGRVSRLVTDTMFREAGLEAGLWTLSRGFARTMATYRGSLRGADEEVKVDGGFRLAEAGLHEFCRYALVLARDQVQFMDQRMEPELLAGRVRDYARDLERGGELVNGSGEVLAQVVTRGSVERKEVQGLSGFGERQASSIIRGLLAAGLVTAPSAYGPLQPVFPGKVLPAYFPTLYVGPERGLRQPLEQ